MTSQEFKRYERFKEEAQFLRSQCQHLRREVDTYWPAWYRSSVRIDLLEQRVAKLTAENRLLKQRVRELTPAAGTGAGSDGESAGDEPSTVMEIKPSVKHRRRKRPGRKAGHPAALRPMPDDIDVHQPVPLPKDPDGCESCPTCNTRLGEFEEHERIVEDIIPSKVVVRSPGRFNAWRSGSISLFKDGLQKAEVSGPSAAGTERVRGKVTGVCRHGFSF